jgi:hypothetical protein
MTTEWPYPLCGCTDSAWLLSHLIRIHDHQDHQEPLPIQDDGVIHAEASVELDATAIVIESE